MDFDYSLKTQPPQKIKVNLQNATSQQGNSTKNTANTEVKKELFIHHIDVGQGEATLINAVTNGVLEFTVLIDGGRYTRGGGTIVRYLRRLNISTIDLMICTHHDADHIEGLIRVLEDEKNSTSDKPIKVTKVVDRQSASVFISPSTEKLTFDELNEEGFAKGNRFCDFEIPAEKEEKDPEIEESGKTEIVITAKPEPKALVIDDVSPDELRKIIERFKGLTGTRGKTVTANEVIAVSNAKNPELKITCLHVDALGTKPSEENNYSIAILVEYGQFRYFTGGDLESEHEDLFIPTLKGTSHLCAFKCGHHGSRNSTSAAFLQQTEARRAFVSCGRHSYYHPDSDLVARLCASTHLKGFFLTNCYYNRLGINPNYFDREILLLAALAKTIVESATEAKAACKEWKEQLALLEVKGQHANATNLAKVFVERMQELKAEAINLSEAVDQLADSKDLNLPTAKEMVAALNTLLIAEVKKVASSSNFVKWNQSVNPREFNAVSSWNKIVEEVKAKIRRFAERVKAASDMMGRFNAAEEKVKEILKAGGTEEDLVKGIVAGGSGHLGTIVLHITGAQAQLQHHGYHIGFWDEQEWDGGWQWYPQICDPTQPLDLDAPKWTFADACTVTELQKNDVWSPQRQWSNTMQEDTTEDFSLVTGSAGKQEKKKEKQPLSSREMKERMKQEKYEQTIQEEQEQKAKRNKSRDSTCIVCGGSPARATFTCTICKLIPNVCRQHRNTTQCPVHG